MPVESAADRAMFLSADDFGVAAQYTPKGQAMRSVAVIFDAEHRGVDVGQGFEVTTTNPHLTMQSSDVVAGGNTELMGDQFVIDGATYRARDFKPDGTGMTVVELQKL